MDRLLRTFVSPMIPPGKVECAMAQIMSGKAATDINYDEFVRSAFADRVDVVIGLNLMDAYRSAIRLFLHCVRKNCYDKGRKDGKGRLRFLKAVREVDNSVLFCLFSLKMAMGFLVKDATDLPAPPSLTCPMPEFGRSLPGYMSSEVMKEYANAYRKSEVSEDSIALAYAFLPFAVPVGHGTEEWEHYGKFKRKMRNDSGFCVIEARKKQPLIGYQKLPTQIELDVVNRITKKSGRGNDEVRKPKMSFEEWLVPDENILIGNILMALPCLNKLVANKSVLSKCADELPHSKVDIYQYSSCSMFARILVENCEEEEPLSKTQKEWQRMCSRRVDMRDIPINIGSDCICGALEPLVLKVLNEIGKNRGTFTVLDNMLKMCYDLVSVRDGDKTYINEFDANRERYYTFKNFVLAICQNRISHIKMDFGNGPIAANELCLAPKLVYLIWFIDSYGRVDWSKARGDLIEYLADDCDRYGEVYVKQRKGDRLDDEEKCLIEILEDAMPST